MNSARTLFPIMVYMTAIETAMGTMQAMPRRQSKKNSMTTMDIGRTTEPARSGSWWAA